MKRRMLVLILVILIFVSLPIHALANTPRIIVIAPRLSFSGTTATCTLQVTGHYATDRIEAVLKLWDGNTCLQTWNLSGTLVLTFSDTYSVIRNHEYTLTADVTINDVARPRVSFTGTCE